MDATTSIATTFAAVCGGFHLASIALAYPRCRRSGATRVRPDLRPPVTIVRPICGLEPFSRETLGASFEIDWPVYEIIFCVADATDPVIPLVEDLMARRPDIAARLIVNPTRISSNPKLDNMATGWRAAQHDWIVFLDSNIQPPPDYIDRLFLSVDDDVGLVSAPPVGARPGTFWAEVECAMLNTWQARVQYAVDSLGFGFAQGKTLFFARRTLENGGFEALGLEPAEDAAATKLVRSSGQKVRLAGPPFPQLLGKRSLKEVWARHVRWARLRRATFPLLYLPECMAGPLPPLAALLIMCDQLGAPAVLVAPALLTFWYAPELMLIRASRWTLSLRTPAAMLARDILLPAIFFAALLGREVVWNGRVIKTTARPVLMPRLNRIATRISQLI